MRDFRQSGTVICLILFSLIFGCDRNKLDKPLPSGDVRARVISGQAVDVKAFEIPKGVFEGVELPAYSKNKMNFQITVRGRETSYVPAPREFSDAKESTNEWSMPEFETTQKRKLYLAVRSDKSKAVLLDLPLKKRRYYICILKNGIGDEMIVFMDIMDKIVDKGLFGYVMIRTAEEKKAPTPRDVPNHRNLR